MAAGPKGTVYRCADCEREVHYPDTLYRDGRCETCMPLSPSKSGTRAVWLGLYIIPKINATFDEVFSVRSSRCYRVFLVWGNGDQAQKDTAMPDRLIIELRNWFQNAARYGLQIGIVDSLA